MTRDKLVIRSGQLTRTVEGKVGGVSSTSATESRPARVKLAVVDADGTERKERLELNDTFRVGSETWRLVDVTHSASGRWTAVAVPADAVSNTVPEDATSPEVPDA
ncbi:hypothetical protein F9278_26405 [Streptomyces phaeolivaceus]|uniref:Uncharacterized protein n=1 Tax=Streptomyces phaeolivaceus TaxID=2653200 RepID=A0A5P8K975_9ACTN|nr:DUF6406 domain-containing protein [Streptomyces phaeolivaceus]QFQ99089.1 hypothetical protein F9278_26405 [Streptomyces phaeolivaceus]